MVYWVKVLCEAKTQDKGVCVSVCDQEMSTMCTCIIQQKKVLITLQLTMIEKDFVSQ